MKKVDYNIHENDVKSAQKPVFKKSPDYGALSIENKMDENNKLISEHGKIEQARSGDRYQQVHQLLIIDDQSPSSGEYPRADAGLINRNTKNIISDQIRTENEKTGINNRETLKISPALTKSLTFRDKLMIGMMAIAYLLVSVTVSCWWSFFPATAKSKGASGTVIGFIFGIYELGAFVAAPILGRYLTIIGSKFMLGSGLFVAGVSSILFGLVNWAPSGVTFIILCFIIRTFQSIGTAAVNTSIFAIVASSYPTNFATLMGLLQTFFGLGYAIGPSIGGALYAAGDFLLPSLVLGILVIIHGLSSYFWLAKQDDAPKKRTKPPFAFIRNPTVGVMVLALFIGVSSIAFIGPTLQPFLIDFNLLPVIVGLMFLLSAGIFTLSAPFWGYLIDHKDCAKYVMLFGAVLGVLAFLFIGPSPIFPFGKQLWLIGVSEVVHGISLGALTIPPFQQCLVAFRESGYPDTFDTYGLVSALLSSTGSLGAFTGAAIGGTAVEYIGFPWFTTVLSLLHLICAVSIILLIYSEKRKAKRVVLGPKNSAELTDL